MFLKELYGYSSQTGSNHDLRCICPRVNAGCAQCLLPTPCGVTELGFEAVESPYHVSDLHTTMLHLMGLDHTKLTYFYHGLEERLTGQRGQVIEQALA